MAKLRVQGPLLWTHRRLCCAQTKKWAIVGPIWRLSHLPLLLVAGPVFALWQMELQKGSQSLEMDQMGRMFNVISCYVICGWSVGITWVKVEVLAPGKFGNIPANTCQSECSTNFRSADQTGALTRRFCCSESCPVTAADSFPGPACLIKLETQAWWQNGVYMWTSISASSVFLGGSKLVFSYAGQN